MSYTEDQLREMEADEFGASRPETYMTIYQRGYKDAEHNSTLCAIVADEIVCQGKRYILAENVYNEIGDILESNYSGDDLYDYWKELGEKVNDNL